MRGLAHAKLLIAGDAAARARFDSAENGVLEYPTALGTSRLGRAAGGQMRTLVTLACGECKRRNYTTTKNKQHNPERIEFKKYCKWCGTHTPHKETR